MECAPAESCDVNVKGSSNLALHHISKADASNTVASSNERSIETTAASATARSFNPDPAEWTLSAELVDNFIQNPPCQDRNADFSYTARVYPDKTRYFRREHFQRKLTNGETVNPDLVEDLA